MTENEIEMEMEVLEAELVAETDPGRQQRLALMIESRRIELTQAGQL